MIMTCTTYLKDYISLYKFCVGPHMTPGKVLGWSNFQKNSLQQNSIFIKSWKSKKFFYKARELFCFCFTNQTICSQLK